MSWLHWVALCIVARGCGRRPVDQLSEQLRGGICRYEAAYRTWEAEREHYTCRSVDWPGFQSCAIDHSDARCKMDAARCLQEQGSAVRETVPSLIDALRRDVDVVDTGDGLLEVRASYAQALGLIHDERAIEPLMEALGHSSPGARSAAALALGDLGPAARIAAAALSDPLLNRQGVADCETQCPMHCECGRLEWNAAQSLARVAPQEAKAAFAKILEGPPQLYPHLREAVLHGMRHRRHPMRCVRWAE